ncbi:hypothetical protein [Hyphomonas sp.]|uniref:hypothetical protein n=1 Tax=Hyphomonas sp. TaxID=87 RepID=UPI003D29C8E7
MEHHYFSRRAKISWLTLDMFAQISSEDLLTGTFSINWAVESSDVLAFRAALESLDEEQLHSRFLERIAFREEDRIEYREEVDAGLFFNAPAAFADYGRWARQLTWTIDECIALSLGRSPDVVNALTLLQAGEPVTSSELAKEFRARYSIAQNWIEAGQLEEEATPGEYLAWLARTRLSCAPDLVEAVAALGHQIADWKAISEELETVIADLQARNTELLENDRRWAQALNDFRIDTDAEIQRLSEQLNQAELALKLADQQTVQPVFTTIDHETLDPRERKSLHKIIFSMAKAKYKFSPENEQWPAVSKIESDMDLTGLSLSNKRIRFHLAAAASTAKQEQRK